ncbi:MAG: hypothetical protein ACLFQE_08370 [Thermotogota bacterium]
MKSFTLDILKTLQKAKEKKGISPSHISRNELYQFIQNKTKKALLALEAEEKITSCDAWNYQNRFYKTTEK